MSENNKWLGEQTVTRRAFLKGSAGAALLVIAGGTITTALTACAAKSTADFEVTSSVEAFHSHKVKILGADVDNPPSEKIITSDGPTHTHDVTLKSADFEAIKKGQTVTVTSTSTGTTPHTHTFAIKKPAASSPRPAPGY